MAKGKGTERKNLETGEIYKLADLVDYQQGSVVSRTLINKEVGTVTLFSFDEGQGLREHTTPYDALVNILDGEAAITISGKEYRLAEGDIIVMPANEPHAIRAESRFKMLLIMVKERD